MQVIRFKGKLFGKTQENQQIKEIKLVKEQNLIVSEELLLGLMGQVRGLAIYPEEKSLSQPSYI
jgi:hypothetical protein